VLTDRDWKVDSLLRLLVLGCLGMGVGTLALMAVESMTRQRLSPTDVQFFRQAGGFLSIQGLGLVWIYVFLREHDTSATPAFGFARSPVRSVLLALGTMLVVFPVIVLLMNISAELMQRWFGLVPPEQVTVGFLKNRPQLWQTVCLGFVAVVLAPVAEEMLFRGILYPFIKQRGYPRAALWGTSILFGVIHFNLGALVPLVGLALVWAWLYERTRNLLAPIAAHVLFNTVNFVLLTADLPDWLAKLIK
jgi:membrane protease YdiL (CAAX protease family)